MPRRNVVSWNAMIAACAEHGYGKDALQLFRRMHVEGVVPNKVTFVSVLNACPGEAAIAEGRLIHSRIVHDGVESDVVVGTAIMNMYGKCGCLEESREIFDKMPNRNVVSWNAMISAYVQHDRGREALQFFRLMQLDGEIPNKVTFATILHACADVSAIAEGRLIHAHSIDRGVESDTFVTDAIINMYAKCRDLDNACRLFKRLRRLDVVIWNSMISVYVQQGCCKEALQLFQTMLVVGVLPNRHTFISALNAAAIIADLAEGRLTHACIFHTALELDTVLATAIMDMYVKCNSLMDARRMFDKMPARDLVAWSAMIEAYAQYGYCKEAFHLFYQMQTEGIMPNQITFVSILNMHSKFGSLEDARRVFDKLLEPDVVAWTAMIAA
eukprot:c25971_g7_i1 orf=321-1475(+)